ncbi:hypothetical protein Drorol1_Dr00020709 [Drosera rotundifolia]
MKTRLLPKPNTPSFHDSVTPVQYQRRRHVAASSPVPQPATPSLTPTPSVSLNNPLQDPLAHLPNPTPAVPDSPHLDPSTPGSPVQIAELQLLDSSSSEETWAENFNIGSIVDGKIQKAKDVGVVVSFEGGKTVEVGSSVRAMVLDISKAERLVDLSLKLEFVERLAKNDSEVQSSTKKRKKVSPKDLKVHATVNAILETVKEEYLVLSLPDHDYAVGYAAVSDYNIQNLTHGQFSSGQR